jgi:acyl transferase domain-containing protein
MQNLNGASRDLVEAIEGSLPADLERRYVAGEGHVYTHRLFEERGPVLRKAVRGRYQNEKVLHERVDAYVQLFERLLDTVSETSQGEQLAEACLASESGKIYMVIANASGRIRAE